MKYLVLRRFNSYGKLLIKGTVVDESEIRSLRLRMAEGKIIPAVSSSTVPAEPGDELGSPGIQEGENKNVLPADVTAHHELPLVAKKSEKSKPPRLVFKG